MADEQKFDVMAEFWKLVLAKMQKESPALIILLVGCWALWNIYVSQRVEWRQELTEVKKEYSAALNDVRVDLMKCNEERAGLSVDVALLKQQMSILYGRRK